MCVFICANPTVNEWLEERVDYAARKSFQLCPLAPPGTLRNATTIADLITNEVPMRIAPNGLCPVGRLPWQRSRLCRVEYGAMIIVRCGLAPKRYKPLESITEAWSRLLFWFGWGR